jgi:hypothetical protein
LPGTRRFDLPAAATRSYLGNGHVAEWLRNGLQIRSELSLPSCSSLS